MGSFGGFYKGEKKKPKKGKEVRISAQDALILPEIVAKKKKDQS